MKKILISIVLMLCMLLSVLPMTSLAAQTVSSGKCGDNLTWKLDADGVLTISGTGEMQGYNYFDNTTGTNVFGNEAWNQASPAVKRVVVGEGVTSIGGAAFYNCTQLEEVQLPSTLETIYTYAFQDCTSLKSIIIPASLKYLYAEAFRGCKNLAKIDVHPDNEMFFTDDRGVLYSYEVTYGGSELLCLLLAPVSLSGEYKIHPKATILYSGAFEDCTKLTSVTLPENIGAIRTYLFSGCTSLTSITIPSNASFVEDGAFSNCTALKSITFEGFAMVIAADAFTGVTADVYYPADIPYWSEDWLKDYGGKLTWHAVDITPPAVKGEVTRVFGATRYDTSFKAADELKKAMGVPKFRNIIVACGTNFPDALAGTYLAAQKNAPILLTSGKNVRAINTYIRENLTSGGTVYLLGSTGVVPNGIGEGINNSTVKRLGGATRYDTNLQILKEAGVEGKDIIVCTGLNFADSLSASACGLPILLVKDGLLPAQKEFLKSVSGDFIIVGGNNAVNATVEKQLKDYGNVKRLAGANRYDTSVLVAKEFFDAPTAAVLAYAQNFPDGLCGGPLAYALNAPLILTDNNKPAAAVKYTTELSIKSGCVLGGTGLISDKVVRSVFSMTAADNITEK